MYSVAAGATGVGLLALAQPAHGEIVYTPADVAISVRILHSYALDLNHDGTTDFFLNATSRQSIDQSGGTSRIIAKPAQNNFVVGFGGKAAALQAGQPIGIGRKFAGLLMASLFTFNLSEFQFGGQWANVVNRYLGLKFQIDGQTHYGWARLTVGTKTLTAKLTGYAYETTANAPIVAGKTSGTDEASLAPSGVPVFRTDAPPPTLGALALGAPALSFWRREEKEEKRD
jgi:hypothetical protein